MRKIYSLVLMAAMLLLGTNSWAVDVQVSGSEGTTAELQAAIDAAATGTTLTLQHDFNLSGPVWLGTADYNGDYKSITLDLNGHKIKRTVGKVNAYMFILSHGELLVRNSSATTAEIQLTGTADVNTQIFTVFGSYRSSRWNEAGSALQTDSTKIINTRDNGWFSHLELGQNVKVIAGSGCLGTGIAVDVLFPTEGAYSVMKTNNPINYRTDIYNGNFGLAQGVKVDVYGDIEIAGKGVQGQANKAYCVKVNGLVYSPGNTNKTIKNEGFFSNLDYAQNYDVVGRPAHQGDTIDAPFIHVHSTANLVSDNKSTRSTAVYSSGYSRMLIEGYCEGSVGVYANSGKVEINDAEVVSTSTNYTTPTSDGGAQGGGSAIVINTRDNYTGEIEVTISGDSKVTATTGYAVEEIVTTTADTTKVQNFTIEGGTIEGGNKGAIIVSDKTATDPNAEVVVYGGNISGNTQVGESGNITDILPTNGTDTTAHVTVVTDPVSGKTTIVVSEGAPVPASEKDKAVIAGDENTTVNWKHLDETTAPMIQTLLADMTLKELEINQNYNQTLTLGDVTTDPANPVNVTLTVDHMVLGYKAQIIVNPGSKLIVAGEQGITTYVTSNIVLKASANNYGQFLFNPAVNSNRHPKATIEFTSASYRVSSTDRYNQPFGIPTSTRIEDISTDRPAHRVAFFNYDYTLDDWVNIGYLYPETSSQAVLDTNKLNAPFGMYQILCTDATPGTLVTMKGELVGNDNKEMSYLPNFFMGFANSYTADIDLATILPTIPGANEAVYIHNTSDDGSYHFWQANSTAIQWTEKISPMQAFVILNRGAASASTMNYADMVWTPAQNPSSAPARSNQYDGLVKMCVSNSHVGDYLALIEDARFTSAFDAGEAEKYMNNAVNIYVTDEQPMGIFASDNIDNTYLGFNCVEGGTYTIKFESVTANDLVLVDLLTNAMVQIQTGMEYHFDAIANESNDYRFQIRKVANVVTDMETIESNGTIRNNGVYTLTGQYVGTMGIWNELPAGIYIVDGVKKVK